MLGVSPVPALQRAELLRWVSLLTPEPPEVESPLPGQNRFCADRTHPYINYNSAREKRAERPWYSQPKEELSWYPLPWQNGNRGCFTHQRFIARKPQVFLTGFFSRSVRSTWIFGINNFFFILQSKRKIVSLLKSVLKAIDTLSCVYTCKVVLIYHTCL